MKIKIPDSARGIQVTRIFALNGGIVLVGGGGRGGGPPPPTLFRCVIRSGEFGSFKPEAQRSTLCATSCCRKIGS